MNPPDPRVSALHRALAFLLLLMAFPASADIDTSILQSMTKQAPPSAVGRSTAAAGAATAGQAASGSAESPEAWYQRASALDRPEATSADLDKAAYWYRAAAQEGHTDAMTNLAAMYAEGRGVEYDGLEAARLYRRAAEAGNMRAQYSLALMYHMGEVIGQNYGDAIHWYESAARQGDPNAMNNMAIMYGMGEGVQQSDVEAYAWFALAASRGHANAAENRDLAASEMTPEERREARERYMQLEEQLAP